MAGAQAIEPGAFVAFEDVEVSSWEPIGDHAAHPGPFYLVWRESHQHDLSIPPFHIFHHTHHDNSYKTYFPE